MTEKHGLLYLLFGIITLYTSETNCVSPDKSARTTQTDPGCSLLITVQGKWLRFLVEGGLSSTSVNNGGDPVSCDFESGFCNYVQQRNDNYDWTIGVGRTSSGHTGPITDHSTNVNGHYAYIDSSEHNDGKKARIISLLFVNPTLDHYRVQFWYDMEGRDIGTLNVYVRDHGASLGEPLLSLTGDQDPGWQQACLDIPHDFDRFQIAFEGIGDGNRGDIAIDDIQMSHGSCNISVRNISCDFEQDNCGYELYSESGYRWRRHKDGTPTSNTGPLSDHTSGHGYYLYSESDNGYEGDITATISPAFETNEHHLSVQFWYHMFGYTMGELRVFYVVGERESDDLFFHERSSPGWHQACVNLPLYSHNTRLLFEAEHGPGRKSDIAIDDITLQTGFCSESHVPNTTPATTLTTAPSSHWSRWSGYSACSVTCGSSVVSTSMRTCVGGNSCPGQGTRTRSCSLPDCSGPVDGVWAAWGTWTSCSKSCELGQITRTRSCDNPAPADGGKICQGTNGETKDCSMGPCPSWSHWFEGPCSSSCGNGTMERLRTCSSGHMEDCTGQSYELVPCAGVICID